MARCLQYGGVSQGRTIDYGRLQLVSQGPAKISQDQPRIGQAIFSRDSPRNVTSRTLRRKISSRVGISLVRWANHLGGGDMILSRRNHASYALKSESQLLYSPSCVRAMWTSMRGRAGRHVLLRPILNHALYIGMYNVDENVGSWREFL